MTQTSHLLLDLHSSVKHQSCQRSTCASRRLKRMKSLWRWAFQEEWKPFKNTTRLRFRSQKKNKTFLSYCCVSGSSFCGRGSLKCVPDQWCNFCRTWWENMRSWTRSNREASPCLSLPTATLWNLCLVFTQFLWICISFFCLVRRKWGGNFQKVTPRSLPENWAGSCGHQRSSVTLRLSSVRLTGTRISSSGRPPSRSMDRH